MPSLFKRIVSVLTAVTVCLGLCACGSESDDALERVINSGEFIFGMADDNAPISWFDEDGTAQGLAAEYGELLATKLGASAVFAEVDPENAVDALSQNLIDCYLFLGDPGVKLSAQILSVDTLIDQKQVIVVPAASDITRLIDLAAKQVGVVPGSPAAQTLEQATELSAALVGTTNAADLPALLSLLADGAVQAAAVDQVQFLHHTLSDRASYRIIDDPLGGGDYVLAFHREDEDMRARAEQLLSAAVADGSLAEIAQTWLGIELQS